MKMDLKTVNSPPEWKGDDYLKTNLAKLQKLYDSFFINNENEFVFKGPKDEADRVEFNSLIFNIRNHILKNVPSNYVFEDHTLGIKA